MSRFGASPRPPALRSGCSGASLFGGRKESFPQLRAPPRSFGVRPRTTPLLVFILPFVVSLPLLDSVASVYGGAHPLAMDAHSGNVRGANACALDPPSRSRAQTPPAKDRRDRERDSLKLLGNLHCIVFVQTIVNQFLRFLGGVLSHVMLSHQPLCLFVHNYSALGLSSFLAPHWHSIASLSLRYSTKWLHLAHQNSASSANHSFAVLFTSSGDIEAVRLCDTKLRSIGANFLASATFSTSGCVATFSLRRFVRASKSSSIVGGSFFEYRYRTEAQRSSQSSFNLSST